jgi:hypothetical protein
MILKKIVFVDKERNTVLYGEAGKNFVDALFNFLTLPTTDNSI